MKPSTASFASSVRAAATSTWWRSAASAGVSARRAALRQQVETAAGLVEHVFPHVPVRQWVLSFPWPLRLLFAARPDFLTRVLGVVTRALSTAAKRRAGLRAGADAETGVVTFIQRFGSALNLNIHLHLLALDGAYTFAAGRPRFQRARAPTKDEIERLLDALIRRVVRTLDSAPGRWW